MNTWMHSPESDLIHSALLILIVFPALSSSNSSDLVSSIPFRDSDSEKAFPFCSLLPSSLCFSFPNYPFTLPSSPSLRFTLLNPNALACTSFRPGYWRVTDERVRNLQATEDHYMGGLRTRGPLGYRDIPLSRKEHATTFFILDRRKAIVKVAINHFSPSSDSYYFYERLITIF